MWYICVKRRIQLNVEGGGFTDNNLIHIGAYIVNDPMWNVPKDGKNECAFKVKIGHDLALVVERVVEVGDEFHANYQYN